MLIITVLISTILYNHYFAFPLAFQHLHFIFQIDLFLLVAIGSNIFLEFFDRYFFCFIFD